MLLQRRQQQVSAERERQQQQIDERRLAAATAVSVDRTAEFDIRERQRHEELRRRQVVNSTYFHCAANKYFCACVVPIENVKRVRRKLL